MMSVSPIYVVAVLRDAVTDDASTAVTSVDNGTLVASSAGVPSLPHAVVVGTLLASIAVGAVIGNALVVLSVLTNPNPQYYSSQKIGWKEHLRNGLPVSSVGT